MERRKYLVGRYVVSVLFYWDCVTCGGVVNYIVDNHVCNGNNIRTRSLVLWRSVSAAYDF